MKKLKIGIITHNFPDSGTDRKNAGIFVYDFAKALDKKAEVVVFSPGPVSQIKKINGIKTHFFKFSQKLGNLKFYNPLHALYLVRFFKNGMTHIDKFYEDNKNIDYIISMWAFPSGLFSAHLSRKLNIPFITYCLGSDIYIYSKIPLFGNLIKSFLDKSKFVLADSPDLLLQAKKITDTKAYFLPSASDFASKKNQIKKSEKITLTFLGRLELVKGVDILLSAVKMLKEDDLKKIQVNIIGDGSLISDVKHSAKDLGAQIKIWGNISNQNKIISIVSSSNWLIIPSRSDSIPLVFSESMKLGVPVIVSDLPDLKYLVNKYDIGVTFKKGSVESLYKILKNIISGKLNPKIYRKNTGKAAEIFDLNKTSDKLINLLKESK